MHIRGMIGKSIRPNGAKADVAKNETEEESPEDCFMVNLSEKCDFRSQGNNIKTDQLHV